MNGNRQRKSLAGHAAGQRRLTGKDRKVSLQEIMRVPFLLGRLLFGGFFVMNGINHFKQARQLSDYAASKRVPKPDLAVKTTGPVLAVA